MVPLTASGLAALLIPPAYHLAERSPLQTTNFARGPLQGLLRGLSGTASARARRAFEAARALPVGDGPQTRAQGRACLPADQIEPLHRCYAGRRTRSDRRSPDAKAAERAGSLLKTVRRGLPGRRAVELACGTGQVAGHVARAGLRVTAVDLVAPSGVPEGVTFHQADAAKLPLPDANADLVWTFDAFEHFDDPQAVLDEAWRVLAPGGLLYANFGPLWNSAMGPHQWGRIEIPYLQHLFAATDLDAAADRLGVHRLTPWVNRWPLAAFRRLFAGAAGRFETLFLVERQNVRHISLVERHPGCFVDKVEHFDELTVRGIEVLLRKRR